MNISALAGLLSNRRKAMVAASTAAVLGLGALLGNYAAAVTPTLTHGISFLGAVTIARPVAGVTIVFTVPADKRFMLTDLIITNGTANLGVMDVLPTPIVQQHEEQRP
jgi:hypothetical protein